jgi:hypothetical protein
MRQRTWGRSLAIISIAVGGLLLFFTTLTAQPPIEYRIGQWLARKEFPSGVHSARLVAHQNHLFQIGGRHDDGLIQQVHSTVISPDGQLSAWQPRGNLPVPVYLHSIATDRRELARTKVFMVGGWDEQRRYASIWRTELTDGGHLAPWVKVGDYLDNIVLHSSVIVSDYLYVLGGVDEANAPLDRVAYTHIGENGTLTIFFDTLKLPKPLYRLAAAPYGNRIYITGGYDGVAAQTGVYFATVKPDGSLAGWTAVAALPKATYYHETLVYLDRLVVLGGKSDDDEHSDVFTAQINFDGTLTGWRAEARLPRSLYRFGATTISHVPIPQIYVVGGLYDEKDQAHVLQADMWPLDRTFFPLIKQQYQ